MSAGTFVTDGPLLLAVPVAALAGLVSFASPCVLPLVPGYLSYVAGLTGSELTELAEPADVGWRTSPTATPWSASRGTRQVRRRSRVVAGALLFVLGFTVVFVALRRRLRLIGYGAAPTRAWP